MSQLYISSAEIFSAQLRSYPCHPSSTMTELFLNLVQKLSGIFFSYAIDVSFNVSKSHTLIGKSKTVDFSMILMYLNMILLNCEASVFWFLDKLYLFWPKCVAAGIFHWSSWECAQLIFKRVVLLDWGIRTLKKSANFKLFKDFQFYSRSSYFSSLAS